MTFYEKDAVEEIARSLYHVEHSCSWDELPDEEQERWRSVARTKLGVQKEINQ